MADRVAPRKSGGYVSFDTMKAEADLTYETQGVSDRYSTGIPSLDNYFSGGYGRKNLYELVLISSAPKQLKTTLAMRLLLEPLKTGVPMYWMLAEMSYGETMNMIRAFFYPHIEEADRIIKEAIEKGTLKIACKETMEDIKSVDELLTEIKLAHANGAELFYADPLNYLTKRAGRGQRKDSWDVESEFIDKMKGYLEQEKLTALFVVHNAKAFSAHHEDGMAGSADFPRIATKTIETRIEGRFTYTEKEGGPELSGQILSVELWAARGIEAWRNAPYLLKVVSNPGHKGLKLEELTGDDYANPTICGLNPNAPDAKHRSLWHEQAALFEAAGKNTKSNSRGTYE